VTKYIPALRYDWLTPYFDLFMQRAMPESRFKRALLAQADIQPQHRVLDFGVGTATLSLLAKQLEPRAEVTGIDVDKAITEIARSKIASAGVDIRIDTYDGTRLPYPDDHFDRVVSSLVFHHLTPQGKANALREIRRVLKPGGQLHIADWGKARTLMERLAYLSVQLLDGFETTADNVRGRLPAIIAEAGFGVGQTETFDTWFGPLSLYRAQPASPQA
jgi:ubiquinone/menaquinone biosynthesis C-methylase UbiE